MEIVRIESREDEPLLDAFYRGIYLDAFAHQVEPLEVWKHRLWSGTRAPYQLTIQIAGCSLRNPGRRDIAGGLVYELYPSSRCGLLTYIVIAPVHRRRGIGKRLIMDAVASLHAATGADTYVFGEISDPAVYADHPVKLAEAWGRVELFQRWGARVVDARYVQPRLGPGLERDRGLRLMMFPGKIPLPATARGEVIARFLGDFFAITEGASPEDTELVELQRALSGPIALTTLLRES